MDLVLGLAATSAAVRWVLVGGSTGEGDPIDRGELDIPTIDTLDAGLLVHAILNPDVIADNRIRVVGVTSTAEADEAAVAIAAALAARGYPDVVSVSDAAAVAALASGIVGITDYDDVAVCVVEPDSAHVALVHGGEVTVAHVDRPADRADALELTSSVIAVLDDHEYETIFVLGSDDVDVIVSSLEAVTEAPVFSAAEADLALARGAALAAGRTLDTSAASVVRSTAPIRLLTGVLAAAVVTFVVSVSIALTLDTPAQTENITAAAELVPEAAPAVPPPPIARPLVAFPDVSRIVAKTMIVKAPPAPVPVAEPVYAPPPEYQVPAPLYVPPQPKPRLRDRILNRIPIIGRFN